MFENLMIVTGRWTEDPELNYYDDDLAILTGSIAMTDYNRNKDEDGNYPVYFIRVVVMGEKAERLHEHCGEKGDLVYIKGKYTTNTYYIDDKKKVRPELRASKIQLFENVKTKSYDEYDDDDDKDKDIKSDRSRHRSKSESKADSSRNHKKNTSTTNRSKDKNNSDKGRLVRNRNKEKSVKVDW